MHIIAFAASDLPSSVYEQIVQMYEPKLGIIVKDLEAYRQDPDNKAWVTVARDVDGTIYAWALSHTGSPDCGMFQIWVKPELRRQGIGTRLWLYNQTRFPKHRFGFFSHDRPSKVFFKKVAKYSTNPSVKTDINGGLQASGF